VDVADVAKCMILLMGSGISEQRYIISAENRDYKNVVGEIARGFNMPEPKKEAKPWMMELTWRATAFWAALTGGSLAIDKVAAQSASVQRNFDNSKIKKAIGIEFKPVSQSILEVCDRLKM